MKTDPFTTQRPESCPCRSMRLWAILALLISAGHIGSPCSRAVSILTGPTLTRASGAPLAGLLQLSTDLPTRVSVAVRDGSNTWQRTFFDYATNHSLPLLGFKPGRTNAVTVTVYDAARNSAAGAESLAFVTSKLPSSVPHPTVLKSDPSRMEPGYTLNVAQDEG